MFWRKYRKEQNFFNSNRKTNQEVDKDGSDDITTASSKIKFIDSTRFMASSLPNLVNNLPSYPFYLNE